MSQWPAFVWLMYCKSRQRTTHSPRHTSGSSLYGEQAILGVPSSLTAFYSDTSRPRIPALAVASGSFVYIYRNFRPHYKFTVPTIEIDVEELKVWEGLAKCSIEIPAALSKLTSMRYVLVF